MALRQNNTQFSFVLNLIFDFLSLKLFGKLHASNCTKGI